MSEQVKITGLTVRDIPRKAPGEIECAFFDCHANGFGLTGCLLVKTRKNGFTVYPPLLPVDQRPGRAIKIEDAALRHRMTQAARDAYRAMGGAHAGDADAEAIAPTAPEVPSDVPSAPAKSEARDSEAEDRGEHPTYWWVKDRAAGNAGSQQ